MKAKLVYAGVTILALVIVAFLGLTIFVKSYLKSEKVKAFIIPLIEDYTGTKAKISSIDIAIFSGIKVKGISLLEPSGDSDIINVKEFRISYRLLPLLKKQIVVGKLEVLSPKVLINRSKNGEYNFDRILDHIKYRKQADKAVIRDKKSSNGTLPPVSLVTDKIVVRDIQLYFTDEKNVVPNISVESDLELRMSMEPGLSDLRVSGKFDLRSLKSTVGGIVINTTGHIDINEEAISVALVSDIGNEKVGISGNLNDYLGSPVMRLDVHAGDFDLEKLLALIKVMPAPDGSQGGELPKVSASGQVRVEHARYPGINIDNFNLDYAYTNGVVAISPIDMHITGGDKITAKGPAKGEIRFQLDPERRYYAKHALKTLKGNGSVELGIGEIRGSKILSSIAMVTGLENLKDLIFQQAIFKFDIRNEVTAINGFIHSDLIKLDSKGKVGFDKSIDLKTDLRVAPALSTSLTMKAGISDFTSDEHGWTIIPLTINGTTESPYVGINTEAVAKQAKEGILRKIKRKIFDKVIDLFH